MRLIETRAPARAPGLELIGELRDSGYAEAPSTVRRADGQTIQLTPLLYQLLEAIDGERDVAELADELSRRCGKVCEPEDVRFLLEQKLAPMGLLCDAEGAAPHVQKHTPLLALRFKFVVSDPAVTKRITAPFAVLFRRWIVVPVLVAFTVAVWWVLFRHGLASATRQAFDEPSLLLGAFLLAMVSAGWHEFGHAAACRFAGAAPGAMGAGLYIVWPAFYTDVDDANRLDRWGRLVVDLGGLYFNAVAAVAVMAVWLAVRVDALLLVVATQLLLMLRQLAPVIRADGYHILSDLVGVPDLFLHIRPTLAGLWPTNWGKPQPLRRGPRWAIRAWVLTVVPLLMWMILGGIVLLPRLVATAWVGLQQQGRAMGAGFGDGNVVAVSAAGLRMVALVLPVAAGTYMLVRIVRKTGASLWSRTEDRPLARGGLALTAVAVGAFAWVAWWPEGQYQPVRADERGTLDVMFAIASSDRAAGPTASSRTVRPIPGVEPRTGYALVPRNDGDPALLLVRGADGTMRSIVTDGRDAGLAFPFTLPDPPDDGGNQALAVNTGDGTVVYDVAVALVWVKDGAVADNRNEAWALSSCTACTTVAVAFQVVLVVGESEAVAPINVAVAANGGCIRCHTTALAVQLVVTLDEMPPDEVRDRIEAAMTRLDGLETLPDPYAEIKAVRSEILTILQESGLIDEDGDAVTNTDADAGTASTTTTTMTSEDDDDGGGATSTSTTSTTTRSTSTSSTTVRTTSTTSASNGDSDATTATTG